MSRSHGATKGGKPTREYTSWAGMIARCTNQKNPRFHQYGGRGITICREWLDSFERFLADMGTRPPGTTLDRYPNPDGNYEPGNCRWATALEQSHNSRAVTLVKVGDDTLCVKEWARRLRVNPGSIWRLTDRMTLEEAVAGLVAARAANPDGPIRRARVATPPISRDELAALYAAGLTAVEIAGRVGWAADKNGAKRVVRLMRDYGIERRRPGVRAGRFVGAANPAWNGSVAS